MSDQKIPTLLVPTDFSPVGACAFNHAIRIAEILNGEVKLLHIVAKEKEMVGAQSKLDAAIAEAKKATSVNIEGIAQVGNIFDDIGGVADKVGAKLIFMGTHGAKGLQKVTGSYALKVITRSNVPFVVVQRTNIKEGYHKIVMPLDLIKESVQQLKIATELAKKLGSSIHLYGERHSDEYLVKKVKSNIIFARKYLQKEGVTCAIKISDGKKAFHKEVIEYAQSENADLVTVVNVQESLLSMFGGFEQHIIANEAEIPALIINPMETSKTGYGFMFG